MRSEWILSNGTPAVRHLACTDATSSLTVNGLANVYRCGPAHTNVMRFCMNVRAVRVSFIVDVRTVRVGRSSSIACTRERAIRCWNSAQNVRPFSSVNRSPMSVVPASRMHAAARATSCASMLKLSVMTKRPSSEAVLRDEGAYRIVGKRPLLPSRGRVRYRALSGRGGLVHPSGTNLPPLCIVRATH